MSSDCSIFHVCVATSMCTYVSVYTVLMNGVSGYEGQRSRTAISDLPTYISSRLDSFFLRDI